MIVVGFFALHPKTHWSKLVTPTAAIVRSNLIAKFVHTLDGSRSRAQIGYWGCSMNAHPPVMANNRKTSKMNRINLDPIRTCRQALTGMLGIPLGHFPDRTGGGPPSRSLAAEYDSEGGPPPAPTPALI